MVNSIVEWYRPEGRRAQQIPLADAVRATAFDRLRVRGNKRVAGRPRLRSMKNLGGCSGRDTDRALDFIARQ